jgi:hypothetical protein
MSLREWKWLFYGILWRFLCSSDYTASNELETIYKEEVVALFKAIFCHFHGGTEKRHEPIRIAGLQDEI